MVIRGIVGNTSPTHLVPHKSMLLNFNGNGTLLHYVSGYSGLPYIPINTPLRGGHEVGITCCTAVQFCTNYKTKIHVCIVYLSRILGCI